MDAEERYWRRIIADEIKAEHDKVRKYYMKRGNMTTEEHTRLNIFALCESIARTEKEGELPPKPVEDDGPKKVIKQTKAKKSPAKKAPAKKAAKKTEAQKELDEVNSFIEEEIQKQAPKQNELGELL